MRGYSVVPDASISVVRGIPLEEEPGLGALTLPGFLRGVTERYGSHEAVAQPRANGSVERWSYEALWSRSVDVGRALVACGVDKGTRVGILMTNRAEFLSATFGTSLAGGVVTPLSTFSTAAELDYLLSFSACSILLLEPQIAKTDYIDVLRQLAPELDDGRPGEVACIRYPFLRHVVSLDRDEPVGAIEPWANFVTRGDTVSAQQVEARGASVVPADPGGLFFSSGTTGRPKGILNAHRGITIQLWRWGRIFGVKDPPRCWTANGMFWSGQFGMAIGCALGRGGTLVMQSTFKPQEALSLMQAEKVSLPMGWPHQWAQLAGAPNFSEVDLSSLVYVAAESPLRKHPTVKTDWSEPTRIYGNTETFTLSAAYESGTPEELLANSYGCPLPGMTIKIVDPFTGAVMPMGERGEIAVKGATLMIGYLGVPPEQTFDEEGYFRTGDGGYVDAEGRVYWEGRLNDIIKTGGANVSPVEIDAVIIQCPGVKATQTVGIPDDLLGELVVTCLVLHDGADLDERAVRDFARRHLASYKVPRRVLFLDEEEFSTTSTAKAKAAELRKLATQRLKSTH